MRHQFHVVNAYFNKSRFLRVTEVFHPQQNIPFLKVPTLTIFKDKTETENTKLSHAVI